MAKHTTGFTLLLICSFYLSYGQQPFTKAKGYTCFSDTASYKSVINYVIDNSEDKTDSCLILCLNLLHCKELNKFPKYKGLITKNIGVLYDNKGNLDSALYYLSVARQMFKKQKNILEESHVVNNIAVAYYLRGIYELAIKNHLEALTLREKAGSLRHVSQSLNNLGLLYRAKKDYVASISMYNKSLHIKKQLNDSTGILNTLMNIGACYSSWNKYDSALVYAGKSEQWARAIISEDDIIGSKANKASALVNMGQITQGLAVAKEVLQQPPQDTKTLLTVYETLSDGNFEQKNYLEALRYSQAGLQQAIAANRTEQIAIFYKNISAIYEALYNTPQALFYLQKHNEISDSLYKEESSRQVNEMAAVYENKKKEAIIGTLNSNLLLKEHLVQIRKKERNIFIAASVGFLLLSLLLLYFYRLIKRSKNALNEKNSIIENSLKEKEMLMKEIHHRVKNNLQLISSLLNMQTDFVADEKAIDAITESKNRVMSMSLIHQNLYQQNNITSVNMQQYTTQLCHNLLNSYSMVQNPVRLNIEAPAVFIDIDKMIPVALIVNELITNSFKYGFAQNDHPVLTVQIAQHQNELRLLISDNGPGLINDESSVAGTGFGYKIIHTFLRKHNGQMNVVSDNGFKTTIIFPDFFEPQIP